jgi:hypothetical protein
VQPTDRQETPISQTGVASWPGRRTLTDTTGSLAHTRSTGCSATPSRAWNSPEQLARTALAREAAAAPKTLYSAQLVRGVRPSPATHGYRSYNRGVRRRFSRGRVRAARLNGRLKHAHWRPRRPDLVPGRGRGVRGRGSASGEARDTAVRPKFRSPNCPKHLCPSRARSVINAPVNQREACRQLSRYGQQHQAASNSRQQFKQSIAESCNR